LEQKRPVQGGLTKFFGEGDLTEHMAVMLKSSLEEVLNKINATKEKFLVFFKTLVKPFLGKKGVSGTGKSVRNEKTKKKKIITRRQTARFLPMQGEKWKKKKNRNKDQRKKKLRRAGEARVGSLPETVSPSSRSGLKYLTIQSGYQLL